jgi:AraC-like DNA-binding protein
MLRHPEAAAQVSWGPARGSVITRFILCRQWFGYYHRGLSGMVFWGQIDHATVREMAALLPLRFAADIKPHPTFIDLTAVDDIDEHALALRNELFALYAANAGAVTRLAVVYRPGLAGAISHGVRALLTSPFQECFFRDRAEALRWLGRDDHVPLQSEVERLRAQVSGEPTALRQLRALLDTDARKTLEGAARELALSTRSLQRRLAEAGTSFQAEVASSTVRCAQKLLARRDASVTSVAFELGCSSAQHLSTLFKRQLGCTPSEWKSRLAPA